MLSSLRGLVLSIFLICFAVVVPGCATVAALTGVAAMERAGISYADKVAKREAAFIADYRREAQARADELTDRAIKSVTDANGMAKVQNVQALNRIKLENYARIEAQCTEFQQQFNEDREDIATLSRYAGAMREYFKAQNDRGLMLQQSSKQIISTLDKLSKKVGETPQSKAEFITPGG